jgi:hypothetical protein
VSFAHASIGFVPVIASRIGFYVIAGIVLGAVILVFAAYFLFFRD